MTSDNKKIIESLERSINEMFREETLLMEALTEVRIRKQQKLEETKVLLRSS